MGAWESSEPGRFGFNGRDVPLLTRFAPSPTGYLHLGHVVNAVCTWGLARARGGHVLLRIEDHDRSRCRPEYEAALLEDLAWLGFEPDAGPVRQQDAGTAYADALTRLSATAHVYACDCSRRTLAAATTAVQADGIEAPYPGTCRNRGLEPGPGRGLRVVLPPGVERFHDDRLGPQAQTPATQCGDLLLRDRDGHWTYQFAVTVDDLRHNISLVVRGEDLLASTGRQLRLARMLGRTTPPAFFHHALIRHASGQKLSKSAGDTGVRTLRAAGASPESVIGRAASLIGLLEPGRPLAAREVASLFGG